MPQPPSTSPSICNLSFTPGLGSSSLGAAAKTRQVDLEFAGLGAGRACVVARAQQLSGRGEVSAELSCGCLDPEWELRARRLLQVRGAVVVSERKAGTVGRKQRFTSSLAHSGWMGVSPTSLAPEAAPRARLCSAAPLDLWVRTCPVPAAWSAGRC